jgi:DNA modification methylase
VTGKRIGKSPLHQVAKVEALKQAALDKSAISVGSNGTSPHQLYKYPARFSPRFASAAIRLVTDPGDVVLDPFMGSGTTVIEGIRHDRRVVGVDVSPISTFLVRSLLQSSRSSQLDMFYSWFRTRVSRVAQNIGRFSIAPTLPVENLELVSSWRHLRLVSQLISNGQDRSPTYDRLTRQTVLRTCQWAFDVRTEIPPFPLFVSQMLQVCEEVLNTCHAFSEFMDEEWGRGWRRVTPSIFEGTSSEVLKREFRKTSEKVDAVVTSPPYPGVHVLYGKWQVRGRRETDLPLWIIDSDRRPREGDYTLHSRRDVENNSYFQLLAENMCGVRNAMKTGGYMVQMVGFNDPQNQLERFVKTIEREGFSEVRSKRLATFEDGRLWREVPSRRWYANAKGSGVQTKKEVVLIFRSRD